MSEPAPGPYRIEPYVDAIQILDADGRAVCSLSDRQLDCQGMPPENARLLAASWSLLEAAENLLERFMSVDEDHSDFVYGEDLDELRDATRKAKEGKQWKPPEP